MIRLKLNAKSSNQNHFLSIVILVKKLTGKARLQFTRKPFTHWSLSFITEPLIDLAIESQIQGRQMQSNLTSLISTAVKKAIRRKHTLPNYKLRFKPFFNRLIYDDIDMPIQQSGTLEVTIRTLARLNNPGHITQVYATLTLARYPFVTANQIDEQNLSILLDIEIHKAKNQQIGIIFKQTSEQILIETIIPNTPAAVAKLKRGDILLSIEGRRVIHINHVAKILKNLNKSAFTMRVERTVHGVIKNDAITEDFMDVYEDFNIVNISFSKNSDTVQIGANEGTATKSITKDPPSSNESSISSTPSNSPRKVMDKAKQLIKSNSEASKGADETPKRTPISTSSTHQLPQHSTIDCSISNFVKMNDSTTFYLNQNTPYAYLNVNIFGRSLKNDNILLGYLNIPLDNVLSECSDSNLYIEKYMLNPPEIPDLSNHPLSTQSGFSSQICFGDACISFMWNQELLKEPKDGKQEKSDEQQKNTTKLTNQGSQDKLDSDKSDVTPSRQHDFIRTQFNRSTLCDFCGKKIWLKDAVQCRECSMCCHKKCIVRCQSSTVCSQVSESRDCDEFSQGQQPEFKVTAADGDDDYYEVADEAIDTYKLTGHRQSFSDLLAQGIKRVNSANNLNIPTIVSSLTQNSKSLPPTPQHTPSRKQSITQNLSPFSEVVKRLEQAPVDRKEMSCEEIRFLVEPLMSWGSLDNLMDVAKSSAEFLYAEHDVDERLNRINLLVS